MNNAPQTVSSYAMLSLMEYLEKEYYMPLERLCPDITAAITEIHHGDVHQSASLFTTFTKTLIEHVGRYVRLRRVSLVPYLNELEEKEDSGHDCRSCSTSCTIRHNLQLSDIQHAHSQIKATLEMLRSIETPLHQPDAELRLFKEVKNLDEILSELLYLEETALIPRIKDAQMAINAHE